MTEVDIINRKKPYQRITIKNTLRLARGGKPLESQIKVPKNENRQYIYARHPEMGILKSRVSRLPQSGVTYYDITPFYYITLSGNLVEKVMKDPIVINLIEEDLIQWLQIPSVQDEANARKQIRFLINDHVAHYPSDYKYNPPNGFDDMASFFLY